MPRLPRSAVLLPAMLLLAAGWGCGGDDDSPTEPEPGPDLEVASLAVTPSSAVLAALGDTVRFTAVARNAAGEEVPAEVSWSSTNPAIVTVDTSGLAESVGGGAASIIATADGFADTAAVTVTLTTLVWRAAVSGSWHDPDRWRGGVVPSPGDTARIAIAGAYTVTLDQDTEVARLELGGGGGPQTLATGASAFTVGSLRLEGGARLLVDGTTTVQGATAWRSGTVEGDGTLVAGAGGDLTVGGGAPILELRATLENRGTVAIASGARLDIPAAGRLQNPAGSLVDFRSDGSILPYDGGAFTSAGTIRKSGGATVSAVGTSSGDFVSEGAIQVQSGALRIATGQVYGEVDVDAGLRLEVLGGTILGGAVSFTGAGSLDVDGSVTIGDQPGQTITVPHLVLNNGTVGGQATIAVTDSLVWVRGGITGTGEVQVPAGASARLVGDDFAKLLSGRSLRLGGSLTTGSALDLELDQDAAVLIESTGRWEQGYRGRIEPVEGGSGSLRIDGVFAKTDVETTLVRVPTVCTGSLLLDAGILVMTDSFELTEAGLLRGGGRIDQPGQNIRLGLSEEHGGLLAGTIEPDRGGLPAWLGIAGPASLAPTTLVLVDLADLDPIRGERLVFADQSVIAGTVSVTVSLVPEPGEIFRIVTRPPEASRFDAVIGAEGFDVVEDDSGVRLIWPEER